MNRATRVPDLVAPKDDVFGLVVYALNATQSLVHVHTHRHKGEFLLADAQVAGVLLSTSFSAYCVHTLSVILMEKRLSGSVARLYLPEQCVPHVLVPCLWYAIRQMSLEEGGMSIVVLCSQAWFRVDIQG